jgi:hypothetical protein
MTELLERRILKNFLLAQRAGSQRVRRTRPTDPRKARPDRRLRRNPRLCA